MRNNRIFRIASMFLTLIVMIGIVGISSFADGSNGLSVTNQFIDSESVKQDIVEALVEDGILIGNGIRVISNQDSSKTNSSIGTFTNGSEVVDFNQGVILSTGNAKFTEGPTNNYGNKTQSWGKAASDSDLKSLTSNTLKDETVLEFHVIPENMELDKQISFQYVVASEEYNEYIQYSDIFGLFITQDTDGSGKPINYKNLAVLPDGSNTTIQIGNINYKTNSQYYRNNKSGDVSGVSLTSLNIPSEMDGFTTVFSVSSPIDPYKPVYVKLAIADCTDDKYDSNVFIKMNSIKFIAADPGEINFKSWDNTNNVTVTRVDDMGNGVDGTVQVTYSLFDSVGNKIGNSVVIEFKDGVAEKTFSVPSNTEKIQLQYPTNGAILKNGVSVLELIKDKTKPVLTLVGESTVTITSGEVYSDKGATALDQPGNVDLTSSITDNSSSVNSGVPGTYTVTYNVTDGAGNSATPITRTVVVKPAVPVIEGSENGLKTVTVKNTTPLSEVKLYDKDGNLVGTKTADENGIVVFTGVEPDTGYKATQIVNGVTSDKTSAVDVGKDVNNPVITLVKIDGQDELIGKVGQVLIDPGAKAYDEEEKDITFKLITVHPISKNEVIQTMQNVTVEMTTGSAAVVIESGEVEVNQNEELIFLSNKAIKDIVGENVKILLNGVPHIINRTVETSNDSDLISTVSGSSSTVSGGVSTVTGGSSTVSGSVIIVESNVVIGNGEYIKVVTGSAASVQVGAVPKEAGKFSILYFVKDLADNFAKAIRSIIIKPADLFIEGSENGKKTVLVKEATSNTKINLYNESGDIVDTGISTSDGTIMFTNVTPGENYTATQVVNGVESDRSNKANVGADYGSPVITIIGDKEIIINFGDLYNDLGAKAMDPEEGDLTGNIIVLSDVDSSKAGKYTIKYNVSDSAENKAQEKVRIVVVKPIIPEAEGSLNGVKEVIVTGSDPNTKVTLYDESGGIIDTQISDENGNVTFKNVQPNDGYSVTQTVNDVESDKSALVNVGKDETSPIISLIGDSIITITAGDAYIESGATAIDQPFNLDLTARIVINSGKLNSTIPGIYVITYDVTDDSGNKADQVTRTITVKPSAPKLKGSAGPEGKIVISGAYEGAKISLFDKNGNLVAEGVADNNGNCEFKNIPEGSGYKATQTVNGVESDKSNGTSVYKMINVAGLVTERDHSKKIENAKVALYDLSNKLIASTTSDKYGQFKFEDQVPSDFYNLVIEKSPYQVSKRMLDVSDSNTEEYSSSYNQITVNVELYGLFIDLSATPSSIVGDGLQTTTLRALVLDENQNPISGIKVMFESSKGSFIGTNEAITNSNGLAQVMLKSEKIEGIISLKNPVTATVNDEQRGLYATDKIYMTFEPTSLVGVVTDSDSGKALGGVKVYIEKDLDSDGIIDFRASTVTDENGNYSIPVPKGNTDYDVVVVKEVIIGNEKIEVNFKQKGEVGVISGAAKEEYKATNTVAGIISMKQTDGGKKLFDDTSKLKIKVKDQTGNVVNSISSQVKNDGSFISEGLANGVTYSMDISYEIAPGMEIVVGQKNVKVSNNGEISISEVLIDPYGTITDSVTGKVISGVNMKLYYANTPRNIANGKKPDSLVNLPILNGFKPADNANPQYSDDTGAYAWMVFPTSDYYLTGERSGYNWYRSGTISVEYAIVKHDFSMIPIPTNTSESNSVIVEKDPVKESPDMGVTIFTENKDIQNDEKTTVKIIVENLSNTLDGDKESLVITVPEGVTVKGLDSSKTEAGKITIQLGDITKGSSKVFEFEIEVVDNLSKDEIELGASITSKDGKKVIDSSKILIGIPNDEVGHHKAYINGYPDQTVRPDRYITRAEVAAIMVRISELKEKNVVINHFKDVDSSDWYSGYIETAYENGYVIGYEDDSFRPNSFITRAELATIISNYKEVRDDNVYVHEDQFNDISSHWSNKDVNEIARYHYIKGYEDGSFKPDQNLTRTEMVTIINRVLNRYKLANADNDYVDLSESHWGYGDILEASRDHDYVLNKDSFETIIEDQIKVATNNK